MIDLEYQYRMNEDIMLLSNKLIYGNRLRCGSKQVAEQSLQIPNIKAFVVGHGRRLDACANGACWMEKLLDEK